MAQYAGAQMGVAQLSAMPFAPTFKPFDSVYQQATAYPTYTLDRTWENIVKIKSDAGQLTRLLNQCLATPNCLCVLDNGSYWQLNYGTRITGWSQNAGRVFIMTNPRNVTCNDTAIAEPYRTTCLTQWCVLNPGECDTSMAAYCSATPTAKQCACINSPVSKYKYNPYCQDMDCIKDGYATSSMVASKKGGCSIVDCKSAITLTNEGGVSLVDPTIVQKCSGTITDAAGSVSAVENADAYASASADQPNGGVLQTALAYAKTYWWALALAAAVLAAALLI